MKIIDRTKLEAICASGGEARDGLTVSRKETRTGEQ